MKSHISKQSEIILENEESIVWQLQP